MQSRTSYLTLSAGFLFMCGVCLPACSPETTASAGNNEKIVNFYNWSDYIAPDTIERFEAEYGIEVNYDVYSSSEVLDVKMLSGNSGYDVVVHSNQFSSRLAPIGVYEKLDYSRIPNMQHLDQDLMRRIDSYPEVRGYSVPYHWGTTGYAWNVEMVRQRLPEHPMDSADVLFDPAVVSKLADCGVTLLDSPTDLIPMVLAYLGRDPNAVDDESLAAAEAQLKLVRPYILYFSNEKMLLDLPGREVCVAMSWSGDYVQAERRAHEAGIDIELRYTAPREGTGIWVDGLYMPVDAPHKDNAYLLLNFLMRPDIAASISFAVGYANTNKTSWADTPAEILHNPAIYPDEAVWKYTYPVLTVDPKRERPRTRAFARVKSGI
jgi:putrescine transport system substrate-binding protein